MVERRPADGVEERHLRLVLAVALVAQRRDHLVLLLGPPCLRRDEQQLGRRVRGKQPLVGRVPRGGALLERVEQRPRRAVHGALGRAHDRVRGRHAPVVKRRRGAREHPLAEEKRGVPADRLQRLGRAIDQVGLADEHQPVAADVFQLLDLRPRGCSLGRDPHRPADRLPRPYVSPDRRLDLATPRRVLDDEARHYRRAGRHERHGDRDRVVDGPGAHEQRRVRDVDRRPVAYAPDEDRNDLRLLRPRLEGFDRLPRGRRDDGVGLRGVGGGERLLERRGVVLVVEREDLDLALAHPAVRVPDVRRVRKPVERLLARRRQHARQRAHERKLVGLLLLARLGAERDRAGECQQDDGSGDFTDAMHATGSHTS